MRVLVTGGAGFIGGHVVETLLELGHEVVVVFDKVKPGKISHIENRVDWVHGDLRRFSDCMRAIRGVDTVIHMAALINVDHSIKYPMPFYETNVKGTMNLLNAVRQCESVRKMVYMSTAEIYGNVIEGMVKEDAIIPDNRSPYASSKFSAERYCLSFWYTYKQPEITIIRGSNTFGPRQTYGAKGAVHAIFIINALKEKQITIYGDGTQERDYIYVKDMARGIVKTALTHDIGGEIINISSGGTISVNMIAGKIVSLVNPKLEITYKEARAGEVSRSCLDPSKAEKLLGWRAKTPYLEGLEETVKHYSLLEGLRGYKSIIGV